MGGPSEQTSSPGWRGWYALALLSTIYALMAVDRGALSVVGEPLKREFDLSDGQLGALVGFAFSATFAIAVLPAGWLVDRVNRQRLLGAMATIWSLLSTVSGFATGFGMIMLTRMGIGAMVAGTAPAGLSMVADIFPPRRRTTAVSLFNAGSAGGQFVIFLLGAWTLKHFGWRAVFFIAGVPGFIAAMLLTFTVKEPIRGAFDQPKAAGPESAARPSIRTTVRQIFATRALVHAIAGNLLALSVQFSIVVWIVPFLIRVHGLSADQAAMRVGFGLGAVQFLASLLIGPVADAISKGNPVRLARTTAAATVCCAVAGIAMTLVADPMLTLAAMVVVGICAGSLVGPSYSLILALSPPDSRGSTLAIARAFSTLVGNAGIAYFTGRMSDAIGGADSIRPALCLTILFHFWAAAHFLLAAKNVRPE